VGFIGSGHVCEHRLSFEDLMAVAALETEVGSKAKFNDCSVLFLAMKLGAILLSGDKPLRKAGAERGLEVRGTLWIFDQLVERKLLPGSEAARKLKHLRKHARFLPEEESLSRISKWEEI
jgi:predicted nucleic acid-binding protein